MSQQPPPSEAAQPEPISEPPSVEAQVREERRAIRRDAARAQAFTLLVAVVGVSGTILATYWSGSNQKAQALEEFERQERSAAYANLEATRVAVMFSAVRFLQEPEARLALSTRERFDHLQSEYVNFEKSEYLELVRAWTVASLVASSEYRKQSKICLDAYTH